MVMKKSRKRSFVIFAVGIAAAAGLTWQTSSSSYARDGMQLKLDTTWQRYRLAQDMLLIQVGKEHIPIEQRAIPRDSWEEILAGNKSWTARDDQALRERQRRQIIASKRQSDRRSAFNLSHLRALPFNERNLAIQNFCAQIPKGGMLHIHPVGTFNRSTVHNLLTKTNPTIKFQDLIKDIKDSKGNATLKSEEFQWLEDRGSDRAFATLNSQERSRFEDFSFLPPGKNPFPRFNSVFLFLEYVAPDWPEFEIGLLDFATRAVKNQVSYVELATSYKPKKVEIIKKIENKTGLTIRLNHPFDRTRSMTELNEKLDTLLAAPLDPYLTGIDFVDDEGLNPAFERGQMLYGRLLYETGQGRTKLHRTMHAGEIGDVRNPRDAMLLGAERLGHGVRLADDPVALEYAAIHRIPVEVNISSNLRLTAVGSVSAHPFLDYLRLGIPVSLSTDDEGIFETDINHECELAIAETDVNYAEMKQMAFNSIETSFASAQDREALKARLTDSFAKFESALQLIFAKFSPN